VLDGKGACSNEWKRGPSYGGASANHVRRESPKGAVSVWSPTGRRRVVNAISAAKDVFDLCSVKRKKGPPFFFSRELTHMPKNVTKMVPLTPPAANLAANGNPCSCKQARVRPTRASYLVFHFSKYGMHVNFLKSIRFGDVYITYRTSILYKIHYRRGIITNLTMRMNGILPRRRAHQHHPHPLFEWCLNLNTVSL
jgi:hypothetical protein